MRYFPLARINVTRSEKNRYRWSNIALAIVLLLCLTSCVTPTQTMELRQNRPDLPVSAELTETPFYAQKDYQCGPAALAAVINFQHPITTPEQLLPLIYIPELKGSLQVEFASAAKQFNHLAVEQDGRLESVLREVAHGNPVLVMQNLGFESYPFWHYAVVIGYNLDEQQIILRSGEMERLVRPFSVFERTWGRAKNWSIVVVPPHMSPVTSTEDKFTRAAAILNTQQAYQTGITRWPESFVLQIGFGNTAFSQNNYALAEQAFVRATRISPQRPEAWNNLAFAQIKQQKRTLALKAIQQAIKLEPDNQLYQQSLSEILTHP
jgi:tetratricopeptide (TPR) repeat protein